MKGFSRIAAAMAVGLGLAIGAGAQEKARKAPSPEAIAKALDNAMTPGEGQKKLGFMVGTFDVKIRAWATPTDPPSEDIGVMVGNWVLGGRYIQMMLAGTVVGEPYNGIGYAGFDNTTKKYVATYMDSGSTGMQWFTGGFDASGSRGTLKASIANPVTGKPAPMEMRLSLTPTGDHVTEVWGEGVGDKMFKMIELTYTKRTS